MDHAEQIIKQIMDDPNDSNNGVLANELLGEFHRGYSLENLRPLLLSQNDNIAEIGIWVASELGQKAKPLLGDVVTLLKHPATIVRFFAIDCVLSSATESNKLELASVIPLLDDVADAVRWKTMDFLSRASREQLQGALDYLGTTEPESRYIHGLQWLLSEGGSNPKEVISFIQGRDAIRRKYGAVAAARTSQHDRKSLVFAASMEDPDIKQFASDVLKRR
jgi:hypothetical protein